jgi:hypothetical protein
MIFRIRCWVAPNFSSVDWTAIIGCAGRYHGRRIGRRNRFPRPRMGRIGGHSLCGPICPSSAKYYSAQTTPSSPLVGTHPGYLCLGACRRSFGYSWTTDLPACALATVRTVAAVSMSAFNLEADDLARPDQCPPAAPAGACGRFMNRPNAARCGLSLRCQAPRPQRLAADGSGACRDHRQGLPDAAGDRGAHYGGDRARRIAYMSAGLIFRNGKSARTVG